MNYVATEKVKTKCKIDRILCCLWWICVTRNVVARNGFLVFVPELLISKKDERRSDWSWWQQNKSNNWKYDMEKRLMLYIWWDCKGIVYFELLPRNQIINFGCLLSSGNETGQRNYWNPITPVFDHLQTIFEVRLGKDALSISGFSIVSF